MRTPLAALALTACLALAACGNDDDSGAAKDGDQPAAALTKAELIAKGDAICKAGNDRIEKAGAGLDDNASREDVVAFVKDTLVPDVERQARELRALEPPAADAKAYEAILDAIDTEVAAVKKDPMQALSSDDPFAGANKLATTFGFEECGDS